MSAALPGVFSGLGSILDQYGYFAVAGFVMLEDFGVPLPGETILIAAAVYAGTGHLNVVAVALVAVAAAIVGDNIGFLLGRHGGRPLLLRYGRFVLLGEKRLATAEDWFGRHGGKVVAVARFVEGLRQANGWIAGIIRMPWLRFLAFNAIGAALWVGVWVTVGDIAGDHIEVVYAAIRRYVLYAVAAAVVVIAALVAWHLVRRRRRTAGTEGSVSSATADGSPNTRGGGRERPCGEA